MKEPVEVVQEFVIQCWGIGRLALVRSHIHSTYLVNDSPVGPDAVIGNIQAYRIAFSDLKVSITECIAQNDSVATFVRFEGIHRSSWKGIEVSTQRINYLEAAFWAVQNGQIVRGQFVAESLKLRVQVGQIPPNVWAGVMLSHDGIAQIGTR